MALQLLDLFSTTLSSGYTAGGTSLTLSSVSGLPASGDYWIAVYDPSNQTGTYEIFKVTSAASGSAVTVVGGQSGTTNRNHASGETVLGGIWNAASVNQLKTDMLASPAFTGTPTAPTASPGTSTTQVATTAFVEQELGVSGSGAYFAWGGDGSDGSVTFNGSSTVLGLVPSSSVYTLTRDILCTDITVNSGVTVKTANYAIFCTGTATINGTVHNDGQDGSNGGTATSSTGGTGGSAGIRTTNPSGSTGHYGLLIAAVAGTAGGNGGTTTGTQAVTANPGTSIAGTPVDSNWAAGATGNSSGKGGTGTSGAGGAARSGGTAGTIFSALNWQTGRHAAIAVTGISYASTTAKLVQASSSANGGAPGGGGGGGDGTNAGGGGGGGGGEGGSGGVCAIFAHTISIGASGVVRANGGTGGNGGGGRTQTVGNVGGGGGGAGGSGGVGGIVWLVYHRLTNSGTVTANGGSGGNGGTKGSPHGTGTDDAANGANGPTGPNGNVIYIPC